ncbi:MULTISPECIES: hypothetical protein [unclassified Streptomyces]|uniref:hypothetical protein n=1 Tax=unclassified Streptomyces TaxID=2593676 RepID=UPI0004BD2924|nr:MULTISPECIES: hypothetical protein [unclassified Streptomyces]
MTGRPEVEEAHAHPDGECARAHVPCAGCGLPASIGIKYGGPMADCRLCHYAWSVHHDPVRCWQRTRTEESLIARIREVAPLLVSARVVLDDIVGSL